MSAPKRIQLRRTKGWRKPDGAVVVARPSKWGNPFRPTHCDERTHDDGLVEIDGPHWHLSDAETKFSLRWKTYDEALPWAINHYRIRVRNPFLYPSSLLGELRGRDLCCWCPLDAPCHADVLLEIANGGAS